MTLISTRPRKAAPVANPRACRAARPRRAARSARANTGYTVQPTARCLRGCLMPRSEARVYTRIWKDDDFVALPATAQRLYFFLLSQEDLALCGVIPLRIPRWARKARNLAAAEIEADIEVLASGPRPFVVVDDETGELLVRSLVRNDEVWKIPNVLKSARESASAIESRMIRAVLLNELLRIPVDRASKAVRDIHGQFVEDLRNGNGNPSPNPSGNPRTDSSAEGGFPQGNEASAGSAARRGTSAPASASSQAADAANPSPNPSGNPSADPSQGKGDGYGPVLQASPNPYPLLPRDHPRTIQSPILRAVTGTGPGGEGEGIRDDHPPGTAALVAEIRAIRPDWSAKDIRRALADEAVTERPWVLIRAAALIVARDPESQQPGRLAHGGPWWAQASARQRATAPDNRPPWCGKCSDPLKRQVERPDDTVARCPDCHPSIARTA